MSDTWDGSPNDEKIDLDLGNGHLGQFFTFQGMNGRRVGLIGWHKTDKFPNGWCAWGVQWERFDDKDTQPLWTIEGQPDEHLTLSPSINCLRCGDHGFVRDGKWVAA